MKYCPSCLEEYESAVESCAECGELLVDEKQLQGRPEFRRVHPDEDTTQFVVAGAAEDAFDADAFTAAVHEAGIPVLARIRRASTVDAITTGVSHPWWEVLVPSAERARAEAIIAETRRELAEDQPEAERAAEEEELESER